MCFQCWAWAPLHSCVLLVLAGPCAKISIATPDLHDRASQPASQPVQERSPCLPAPGPHFDARRSARLLTHSHLLHVPPSAVSGLCASFCLPACLPACSPLDPTPSRLPSVLRPPPPPPPRPPSPIRSTSAENHHRIIDDPRPTSQPLAGSCIRHFERGVNRACASPLPTRCTTGGFATLRHRFCPPSQLLRNERMPLTPHLRASERFQYWPQCACLVSAAKPPSACSPPGVCRPPNIMSLRPNKTSCSLQGPAARVLSRTVCLVGHF
ncbi:hypothetical protein BKA80DRAFT_257434 [Phyllosticta citrichinensis]